LNLTRILAARTVFPGEFYSKFNPTFIESILPLT